MYFLTKARADGVLTLGFLNARIAVAMVAAYREGRFDLEELARRIPQSLEAPALGLVELDAKARWVEKFLRRDKPLESDLRRALDGIEDEAVQEWLESWRAGMIVSPEALRQALEERMLGADLEDALIVAGAVAERIPRPQAPVTDVVGRIKEALHAGKVVTMGGPPAVVLAPGSGRAWLGWITSAGEVVEIRLEPETVEPWIDKQVPVELVAKAFA